MTLTARLLARLPIVGPKTIRLLNEVVALRAELASLQEASDSLDKKQAASDQKQMSLSNGISALRTDLDRLRDVSASLAEKQVASSKEASHLEICVQALASQISELTDRGAADYRVDTERSPKAQLMSDHYLERQIEVLRRHLASDTSAAVTAELKWPVTIQALDRSWWQRLAIPGTNCFTTSDHDRLSISDPGFLNTLGNALTPEEGCILRPMPKWAYLKPILPDLSQKTVLEIGCNNGFFCFEFARLGAAQVTGAEIYEGFYKSAQWMATAREVPNVEFLLTDALLDLRLHARDVVFMSEVVGHFVDPFFGILRAINLAKETLIIDNATLTTASYEINMGFSLDQATGRPISHAWILSDGLMLLYLKICGIPPERVTRYVAPWQNHIVYVVDTRGVANYRQANNFEPWNNEFINLRWQK